MGTVTFLTPALYREVAVQVPPRGRRTLLSLARKHEVPLRYVCRAGNCGTCAVKVAPLRRVGPRYVHLSRDERQVLFHAGKLSRQQYESETLGDIPPLWRLACQYVVRDEDILVTF